MSQHAGEATASRVIVAQVPTAESFAPYGRVHEFNAGEQPDLVSTAGFGWNDAYTRGPLTRENPSLGMTFAPGLPFFSAEMERHEGVEEALMPAAAAIVLTVAAPTDTDYASAEDVRAFVIHPGSAVVLNPGVWHDACRGAAGPTAYYWLASTVNSGSSPWTPIAGGPVEVQVSE